MKNVLEWLEKSAERRPDAVAAADPVRQITYGELEVSAQKLGAILAGYTAVQRPVGLYLEKSVTALQGMMGAVYAGCCYSILDPGQPAERTRKVLETLEPEVILTDEANREAARALLGGAVPEGEQRTEGMPQTEGGSGSARPGIKLLVLEEMPGVSAPAAEETVLSGEEREKLRKIRENAKSTDPLYINFTSGSTGVPKGVAVGHASVLSFIGSFVEIFGITESDVLGNQAPFDFDVSVKDIYSALCTGCRLQIIPRSYFSNPALLMDYLGDNGVTNLTWAVSALCFVSIMNGLEYRVPSSVKRVLFSGEVMPIKHLNHWKKYLPDALYCNLYGPTEITCNCCYYILDRDFAEGESFPLGKSFPGETVFLVSEDGKAVTGPGVEGEIYVSGAGLALGYYRDPERTAAAFVRNPLTEEGERCYRTGDLARYSEDGQLYYSSRRDFQIKRMGHRIELGEIETAAMSLDEVTRACAQYTPEDQKLYLFYTGTADKKAVSAHLRAVLPAFMIPNRTVQEDVMPMTKNGKIDRAALLAPFRAKKEK